MPWLATIPSPSETSCANFQACSHPATVWSLPAAISPSRCVLNSSRVILERSPSSSQPTEICAPSSAGRPVRSVRSGGDLPVALRLRSGVGLPSSDPATQRRLCTSIMSCAPKGCSDPSVHGPMRGWRRTPLPMGLPWAVQGVASSLATPRMMRGLTQMSSSGWVRKRKYVGNVHLLGRPSAADDTQVAVKAFGRGALAPEEVKQRPAEPLEDLRLAVTREVERIQVATESGRSDRGDWWPARSCRSDR